jgi:hypothetical protein
MITRYYFISASTNIKTTSIVIENKSWFPNPSKMYTDAQKYFTDIFGTDQFNFTNFNKL